jgi:hypothetical protein
MTEAERIIAESRAILERTASIRVEPQLPEIEGRLEKWRRENEELDRQRAQEKARMRDAEQDDQVAAALTRLQQLLERHIDARLQAERQSILRVVAGGLGELIGRTKEQDKEIAKLKAERDLGKVNVVDLRRAN